MAVQGRERCGGEAEGGGCEGMDGDVREGEGGRGPGVEETRWIGGGGCGKWLEGDEVVAVQLQRPHRVGVEEGMVDGCVTRRRLHQGEGEGVRWRQLLSSICHALPLCTTLTYSHDVTAMW